MKWWDVITHPGHNLCHIVMSFDICQNMQLVFLAHIELCAIYVCGMMCIFILAGAYAIYFHKFNRSQPVLRPVSDSLW